MSQREETALVPLCALQRGTGLCMCPGMGMETWEFQGVSSGELASLCTRTVPVPSSAWHKPQLALWLAGICMASSRPRHTPAGPWSLSGKGWASPEFGILGWTPYPHSRWSFQTFFHQLCFYPLVPQEVWRVVIAQRTLAPVLSFREPWSCFSGCSMLALGLWEFEANELGYWMAASEAGWKQGEWKPGGVAQDSSRCLLKGGKKTDRWMLDG